MINHDALEELNNAIEALRIETINYQDKRVLKLIQKIVELAATLRVQMALQKENWN